MMTVATMMRTSEQTKHARWQKLNWRLVIQSELNFQSNFSVTSEEGAGGLLTQQSAKNPKKGLFWMLPLAAVGMQWIVEYAKRFMRVGGGSATDVNRRFDYALGLASQLK
eukprot:6453214-Ditylum_brightwellii.AAC.1